jgi:hypothetical protein
MSFLLAQILRAAIRIEKKLDELLNDTQKLLQAASRTPIRQSLDSQNTMCPLCQRPVKYTPVQLQVPERPDLTMEVIVRTCGCEPRTTELPVKGEV